MRSQKPRSGFCSTITRQDEGIKPFSNSLETVQKFLNLKVKSDIPMYDFTGKLYTNMLKLTHERNKKRILRKTGKILR